MHPMMQRQSKMLFGVLQSTEESGYLSFFKHEIVNKTPISKQMVACDKQKTALVCFWSVKYHTHAFLGLGKALDLRSSAFRSSAFPRPRKAQV
jgi:hypothetical protein